MRTEIRFRSDFFLGKIEKFRYTACCSSSLRERQGYYRRNEARAFSLTRTPSRPHLAKFPSLTVSMCSY